jgi:DNA-binding response OmpR family regulator
MTSILIVEDDPNLCRLYDKYLRWAGFDTFCATNCEEAKRSLDGLTPDILLLDMNLPDGNGLAVIDCCKADARLSKTEIVVVSANDQFRPYVEQQGIDYFLCKPISMPMLLKMMKRLAVPLQRVDRNLSDKGASSLSVYAWRGEVSAPGHAV